MSEAPLQLTRSCLPARQHAVFVPFLYKGTSLIRNCRPPQDRRRALGMPTAGSYGCAVSYERGTNVGHVARQYAVCVPFLYM